MASSLFGFTNTLGIANSNPQYPLDVIGNVNVAGNVAASNMGMYRNRVINGDMRLDQGLTTSNAVVCGSMTAMSAAASNALDKWQAATGPASGSLCAQQVTLSTADQVATGGAFNKATILSQVPMNGLTTYIPFDGYSAADVMGGVGAATVVGTSYSSSCKIGTTCIDFTGNTVGAATATSSITYPISVTPTLPITISCWIYVTNPGTIQQIWTFGNGGLGDGTNRGMGHFIYTNSQLLSDLWINGVYKGAGEGVTAAALSANTWTHICSTVGVDGLLNTYINGTFVYKNTAQTSGVLNCANGSNINNLWLGARNASAYNIAYKGLIDDFRIYNRVLSVSEIAALAGNVGIPQAPPSNFVQPLDYTSRFTFDSTLADATGLLAAPTVTGTVAYNTSIQQVGTACLNLTGNASNVSAGTKAANTLKYQYTQTTALTVCAWVYFSQFNATYDYSSVVISFGSSTANTFYLVANTRTGGAVLSSSINGSGNAALLPIVANTWYHTVITYVPGVSYGIYVNGVQYANGGGTVPSSFPNNGIMCLGDLSGTDAAPFAGYIDDLRIYNRVLTAPEIALLAGNASVPPTLTATNLTTNLTFDSTTADAQGTLTFSSSSGLAYSSSSKVGTASLDCTANPATGNTSGSGAATAYCFYNMPSYTPTAFTIAMWLYPSAYSGLVSSNYQFIPFSSCGASTAQTNIEICLNPTSTTGSTYGINVQTWNSGWVSSPSGTTSLQPQINAGAWTHVAATLSGGYLTLWINGVPSTSVSGASCAVSTRLMIGCRAYTNYPFKGLIDDVRIYNTVLTPAQVLALSGRQNLMTQLTFDNTLIDSVGLLQSPSVNGTIAYSPSCKVGVSSLDLTGNTAGQGGSGAGASFVTYTLASGAITFPMTVCCWFKASSLVGAVWSFGDSGTGSYTNLTVSNTLLYGDNAPSSSVTMVINTWYHACIVYNSSGTNYIYVNGVVTGSSSFTTPSSNSVLTRLCIGDYTNALTGYGAVFKGLIDDFRIYNSALTPTQVAGLYYASPNTGYVLYQQPIEGVNVADLAWGTSAAQPATVSAWIKNNSVASSNAQQLALSVQNGANNRSYVCTTSSLPANAWSKVAFTIPGDSNGTWATSNSTTGLNLALTLGTANIYSVPNQVVATTSGATVTTVSNYTICSYTTVGSGTFTVTSPGLIDFLVIGGGGGGAGDRAPGGGAGGCIYGSNVSIAAGTYTITVGGGGAGTGYVAPGGGNGGNSSFSMWTAYGGGGGGYYANGQNGGCGGGGHANVNTPCVGGSATVGGQGYAGGTGYVSGTIRSSAGGGGIGGVGGNGNATGGGDGGPGLAFSISGTSTYYGGGGGGSRAYESSSTYSGQGGVGGGGAAGQTNGASGINGTPNTGGGGGGGANGGDTSQKGGNGGSGIVIIRYLTSVSSSAWNGAQYLTSSVQTFGQSNAFLGNLGNSLLLTGVQLEKGTLATPYEFRPYSVENTLSTTSMSNGLVVPRLATTTVPGAVQVGNGLNVANGVLSNPYSLNSMFYSPGSVVQIQTNVYTSAISVQNYAFQDIDPAFGVTITPKFSNSLFLIQGMIHIGGNSTSDGRFTFFRIGRTVNGTMTEVGNGNSSTNGTGTACVACHNWGGGAEYSFMIANVTIMYVDTPSTLLPITYRFRWSSNPGGGTTRLAWINRTDLHNDTYRPNTISTITVTELAQ